MNTSIQQEVVAMDVETTPNNAEGTVADTVEEAKVEVVDDEEVEEEDIGELQIQYDTAMKCYTDCTTTEVLQQNVNTITTTLLTIIENMNYTGPNATQIKERSIYTLIRIYCQTNQVTNVTSFLHDNETKFLSTISKAKTAKLVRHILDIVTSNNVLNTSTTGSTVGSTTSKGSTTTTTTTSAVSTPVIVTVPILEQERVTRSILTWCTEQKRSFLRQRVEAKLATILYVQGRYTESLTMVDTLLHELKQLDDKQLLVEIHLLESQLYFSIRNISKSKAALTASRTAANAIYVSPIQQAALDSQSGTIHTEETDYSTAHSYFLEAFEQLEQMNDTTAALKALKYMMLCKILDGLKIMLDPKHTKKSANVPKAGSSSDSMTTTGHMLTSKQAVKYAGIDLDAMQAIGKAVTNRNLKELHSVFELYKEQLSTDLLIQHHIQILQEQLLESNLLRIVEPYSCVELHFVATKIDLPITVTERKLSQMILDGTLNGILDQGKGQLILYENDGSHTTTTTTNNNTALSNTEQSVAAKAIQVIQNMDSAVTSLFERSKALRTVMM
jgi:26S proteasome regulatory subunit N6